MPSSAPAHTHTCPPHAGALMHPSPQLGPCLSAPVHAHTFLCIPMPSTIHAHALVHSCIPHSAPVHACTMLTPSCFTHLNLAPVHPQLCMPMHAHALIHAISATISAPSMPLPTPSIVPFQPSPHPCISPLAFLFHHCP